MNNKVIFTKHALLKIEQRFRLYLNPKFSVKEQALDWFNKSIKLNEWEMSPFYKNKMTSKHGDVKIYKYNIIYFIVRYDYNNIIVITVTRECSYDFLNKKTTQFLARGIDTDY